MPDDPQKKNENQRAGTELILPDEESASRPQGSSSNMSFGMVDLGGGGDETAEDLPPLAEPKPAPAPSPKPDSKPLPASKPEPQTSRTKEDTGAKPAPYTIRSKRTHPTPDGFPMARSSRVRKDSGIFEPPPSRSGGRTAKIAVVVILVLALIGAGIYLFLRMQKNAEQKRQAELERLNQQSRDSLMDDRFKNQKGY